MTEAFDLTLYMVRNSEGKFFRAVGYGGGGDNWVEDPTKARIYARLSSARSRITYFSQDKRYPVPQLIEIKATSFTIIDETKRVEEAAQKKLVRVEEQKRRTAKMQLEIAQRDLKRAQDKIASLKGGGCTCPYDAQDLTVLGHEPECPRAR